MIRLFCNVEVIAIIKNFILIHQNDACITTTDAGQTPYGKNGTSIWVENGRHARFDVCGCDTVYENGTAMYNAF